jgi:uncharacterized membrane protein YuzA (DUF378 family)
MKALDVIAAILLIIGGLNWGLIGIFDFNLIRAIFGEMSFVTRVIYIVVAASALYQIIFWSAIQKRWHSATAPTSAPAAPAA